MTNAKKSSVVGLVARAREWSILKKGMMMLMMEVTWLFIEACNDEDDHSLIVDA